MLCIATPLHCLAQAPDATALLAKLRANAEAYQAHLPSVACREHITSQVTRGGKVALSKDVDDLVRVLRRPGAYPAAEEQRVALTPAGELDEGRRPPQLPLMLSDGFFAGQSFFLDAGRMACIDFSVDDSGSKIRLDFKRKPNAQLDAGCRINDQGLEGSVLVDRATGEMVYQRRSVTMASANAERRATYAEITYKPVVLGNETFSLPLRVYAEFGTDFRYTATYSGCKRFTANSRILDVEPPQ